MNNQGGVGYGGGGYPAQQYAPQGQLYDAYGQPVPGYYGGGGGDVYNGQYMGMGQPQGQGQFYPNDPSMQMQGQQMAGPPASEIIPRDPRRQMQQPPGGFQLQQQQIQHNSFMSDNSSNSSERIPRNPHPHIPLHGVRKEPEAYDPSLPTYNATPAYHQIQQSQQVISGPKIIAPSLSSIFQAAADQLSKRNNNAKAEEPVSFAQQQNSAAQDPQPRMEIITGKVTQMQGNVGMVSGEIFFQTTVVVGPMPQVGDKVVVEAEPVSGMPFKFNGKRVQMLSKDLIGDKPQKEKESKSSRRENKEKEKDKQRERDRDRDREKDRDKSDRRRSKDEMFPNFGPLPTMPLSLNLAKKPSPPPASGQLKSILKRNPPPPPIISKHKMNSESEKYRPDMSPIPTPVPPPSSFAHSSSLNQFNSNDDRDRRSEHFINNFKSGSFSLDLRNEFPVIRKPTELEQLYPELLYVNNGGSGRKSPSPKRSERRRSVSPRRRSRSPAKRRRSPSPRRKSRSPKRLSRSPRRRSSPIRRKQRRSTTPVGNSHLSPERRRRSPSMSLLDVDSNESKRIADAWNSEPDIILLDDSPGREKGSTRRGRGGRERERVVRDGDRGIVVTRGSSGILPKVLVNPEFIGQTSSKGPPAPIKFAIGNTSAPPAQSKLVPNPAYNQSQQQPRSSAAAPMTASRHLTKPVIPPNATPKDIVATIEKELKKSKKKKKDIQEPAFTILPKGKPVEVAPLSDEQKLQLWEEERQLMKQKQTLHEITKKTKGPAPERTPKHLQELQVSVEHKLKALREKFDSDARLKRKLSSNDGQSQQTPEELERIQEQIALAKFEEEERRLKAVGDRAGLELLWKAEDKRIRRVNEERLERIRTHEIQIKKDKNWTELKKLREEHGGTAEREMELLRLRELRKKEEVIEEEENNRIRAEEEKIRWMQEEEQVHRREFERLQRGSEGPVRRTIMDTADRQLNALGIQVGQGRNRGSRDRSESPVRRRQRSRSIERPRERRRSRSRSREHRRSLSRERMRDHRRSGSRSEDRHHHHHRRSRSRSINRDFPRRRTPSPFVPRDRRSSISPEVAFVGHHSPSIEVMEQKQIEERMEMMKRQEEELHRRERELYERMHMVERGYFAETGPSIEYVDHPRHRDEFDPDFHRYEQRY